MVSTRSDPNPAPLETSPLDTSPLLSVPASVRKLAHGGSGGRLFNCCVGNDNSQAGYSSQWSLHDSIMNGILPDCHTAETLCDSIAQETSCVTPRNIWLPTESIKNCIEKRCVCRKCARASFFRSMD